MRGAKTTIAAMAMLIAVLGTSACGLGDKSRQAELIAAAPAKAAKAGSATGTITIEATPKRRSMAVKTSVPQGAAAALGAGGGTTTVSGPVVFDFAHSLATLELPPPSKSPVPAAAAPASEAPAAAPPAPAEAPAAEDAPSVETGPTAIFKGDTTFVKRVNRRPAERRVWARLDYGSLAKDDRAPDQSQLTNTDRIYALANSLNPRYVLDLSVGTLAGSVKRLGVVDLDGTKVTRYRANVSLDKANADLDLSDEQVQTRERLFALAGLRRDVNPAEYWVAPDGRIRRLQFTFEQRLIPRVHNDVVVTLDMPTYGGPVQLATPTKDETVRVDRYGRFIRAAIPRSDSGS
jgi:hypothetical protein